MISTLALAMALTAPPAPTYVVERIVRTGDEVRRISVFRNGTAVIVQEKAGARTSLVRQALTDVELQVIVQITLEAYPELRRFSGPAVGPGLGTVELRLAPEDHEALTVRIPLGSVPPLGAARLGEALDNLETDIGRGRGAREDLREWQPKVGEWVELDDGRIVHVLEVLGSATGSVLRLQIGDGPVSVFMSEDELRRVALRRVAR